MQNPRVHPLVNGYYFSLKLVPVEFFTTTFENSTCDVLIEKVTAIKNSTYIV